MSITSEQPLVSIIVPVYNTGLVLVDTVKSLISQTYQNLEVLLIDDGSKEDTANLCDNLQKQDCRIIVFHNQNVGICGARNFGLSQVKGEYISFCDHDDLFYPTYIEVLVKFATNNDADIVKGRYVTSLANGKKILGMQKIHKIQNFSGNEIRTKIFEIVRSDALNTIWTGLYKTSFVKRSNESFNTEFKHGGEDMDFNFRLFLHADKLCIIPQIIYHHFVRTELSTSARCHDDVLWNFLYQAEKMKEYFVLSNCSDKNDFLHVYLRYLMAFLSYSKRMHKRIDEIEQGLKVFLASIEKVHCPLGTYAVRCRNQKELKSIIVLFFVKINKLNFLYKLITSR